ncbi:MAG: OmpH family outer membrane protein [Pyrinomonadaceae bacterium]
MKMSLLISSSLLIILAASVAATAQITPSATSQPGRIVIVNTGAFFDEKAGITRIVAATKQVNAELATKRADVTQLVSRLKVLESEIATARTNVQKGIPVDERAAQTKIVEFERLQREGKYKEDDYNAVAQKRQSEVVGVQYSAVLQALAGYIKQKGYGLVFDASKDREGFLIFATEQYDITKEFITFYNARPITTAAAVPSR